MRGGFKGRYDDSIHITRFDLVAKPSIELERTALSRPRQSNLGATGKCNDRGSPCGRRLQKVRHRARHVYASSWRKSTTARTVPTGTSFPMESDRDLRRIPLCFPVTLIRRDVPFAPFETGELRDFNYIVDLRRLVDDSRDA